MANGTTTMWRSRWAAVGAAVAITLGAGGIGLVDAAKDTGERAVYTAIEPCRLLDTRPDKNIQRNTPLGPAETYAVQAIGDNGQCTGIPADTVALELNVTGLLNTAATDFVIWSGAGDPPNASQLNLALGAAPTPNSVTTELDGANFSIRNKFGNADVIIDIVGVYQDHTHDDRYYTETEVDGALATKADAADVYTKAEVDAVVPVAAGFVNSDGTLNRDFGVVSSTWDGTRYVIDLGVGYSYDDFATVVTPADNNCAARTGSVGGNLLVYTATLANAATQCDFGFVVYALPAP